MLKLHVYVYFMERTAGCVVCAPVCALLLVLADSA